MPPTDLLLSIIFPAYNEEARLPETLRLTKEFVQAQRFNSEIVIVDNGSTDRTLEIARFFELDHPYTNLIHLALPGKGRAVKAGMLAASGKYRFICDVDLAMPIGEILRFIPPALEDVDIAIGSREAPGSVRYNEPAYRHFVGRIFNNMVRRLVLPQLQDTQCGFKCFTAEAAEKLFPLVTIPGWTFDVEVLAIAFKMGYHVQEIPIPWYFHSKSKVKVVRDSLVMARDLLTIRSKLARGDYGV